MPKLNSAVLVLSTVLAFIGGWYGHLIIKPEHFACRVLGDLCRHALPLNTAQIALSETIDVSAIENTSCHDTAKVDSGETFKKPGIKQVTLALLHNACPVADIAEVKSTRHLFRLGKRFDSSDKRVLTAIQYYQNILASHPEIENRSNALESLIQLSSVHALATGLGDENKGIRLRVIEGLQNIASDDAIQLLGQAVISDSNSSVRLKAVDALAALSYDVNARRFLHWIVEQEQPGEVSQAAAMALE
ncbi:HEAT repeat domain-containing protein [Thalassomonas actiniarum]|uniref:HEAT repeat domain-containing protein n=1 Tax=Thalassomonas actiniarum TaxID=485447 RepID=A0AAF0C204_9GAMM|nr:HEAT repeat domain-containing protein [Thalassomonas actiniarum]WDD97300.1 HEAT repeat domain-containing protein [Thalassomonas actiniarum]